MDRYNRRLLAEAVGHCATGVAAVILSAANVPDEQIAADCGVSAATIWRWKTGTHPPRGDGGLRLGLRLRELLPVAVANLRQEEEAAQVLRQKADEYEEAIQMVKALAPAA
ncbi:hypothetical protein I0C86_40585 [Plantactinospora sp. S1510]|uniref:Uncharacterized protein n=1 Tax=Plantactinospora alkalitolerans TaxID=2789879 RepID=A0ABS0HA31_9ACTN|nr:hypothetical protein [Plantactinospora alkalitolerans]MBF9135179.1 hypothetical protein [Plantactinospora alkalitolerans]